MRLTQSARQVEDVIVDLIVEAFLGEIASPKLLSRALDSR